MTAKWCKYVFGQCLYWYPTPDIFNTDQGSQFSADLWVYAMADNRKLKSMDGKGRAIDNIFIERFWRSCKYDYLYLKSPTSGKELYQETKTYIYFYNFERGHQSLNLRTLAEIFFGEKTYFTPTQYSAEQVKNWGKYNRSRISSTSNYNYSELLFILTMISMHPTL